MMEFYLDTADPKLVKQFIHLLPIDGVTTNPSLIAQVGRPLSDVLSELRNILGETPHLFVQVLARDTNEIVEEALKLSERYSNLVIKIPATLQGIAAIKQLSALQIPTLGTAVYSAGQGLLAALSGANYIAPYVSRIDNQGGNGIKVTEELQKLFTLHSINTKVMAASFKTTRQVVDCLLTGCQAVTVAPEIVHKFLSDPAVCAAIAQFEDDWKLAFNQSFIE
ncbi:fructose-6-phosphate aldolase [Avibacterium sp. 20-126]|uniref:transaldolase family protein n=1 Tax=Avibacterium sp. 20-126 TaxID=2911524 RepID=UPI002189EDCD|nr:fructose-6-phosphate aldolase [Avibacterium sp. 20-126]